MKVSREQAAQNRERIVKQAARLFRERGFDGIGVADLMREAGFTHGGFYGHFASKEDLMAEACSQAFADKAAQWTNERELDSQHPLASAAAYYLASGHRDDPGDGCPLATLAVDAARQTPPVRRAFQAGFERLVAFFVNVLPGRSRAAKRRKALSAWSTLVGAMVLARAVKDPGLSDEILAAAVETVGEM
jgi:TetR/AcrR family transcriptional repressor of nem operon